MAPKPTIYDVSRQARVSLATVSRVVHNHPTVRPETRAKVLEAMDQLGYHPNLLASALMTKQTKTIGLLVPDISNPFFAELCRGVGDAVSEIGINVVICNTDDQLDREKDQVRLLRQKGVDGLILASAEVNEEHIDELLIQRYPVVLVARGVSRMDVPSVTVDDFEGGYVATRYLLDLGHRRIALLSGPRRTTPTLARRKGFEAAMEQMGVPIDPQLVDAGAHTIESGMEMTARLLERNPERPTAIVAGNDLIAIGAIKVLRRAGLRIPEDISIVGYDGTFLTEAFDPELTTVRQPTEEIATEAIRLLTSAIADPEKVSRKVVLPPQLLIRASTGPVCEKM